MNLIRKLLLTGVLSSGFFISEASAAPITMGVMGDSLSDEYFENFTGSTNQNWVEQLANYRAVNFGPTAAAAGKGSWGTPRNTGYEYNWALYGATSSALLSAGQHTGFAAQVAPKGIQYGVLAIGANDLIYSGSNYGSIYDGTWSPAQVATFKAGVVNNIKTALDTALASGVKMVLADVPDYGVTVSAVSSRNDAAKRDRVTAVITDINAQLKQYADAVNVPLVDLQGAAAAIFGTNTALRSTLKIGNVNINLRQSDLPPPFPARPAAGFLSDGIHIATPLQGILANLFVTALNDRYGANITPFTEAELLSHRGLSYGGSNTLTAQIGPYSNFVVLNVPEPSTLALSFIASCGLMFIVRAKRTACPSASERMP